MQQEMAVRRQRVGISRQDSRLSVKSLIESIEKSQQHVIAIANKKFVPMFLLTGWLFYRPNRTDPIQYAAPTPV